jgi:ketosteroid isomerase-like protein
MTTRQTIESYFDTFAAGHGWERFLAPDLAFATRTAAPRETAGRDDYLASTTGFRSMVRSIEVARLVVDGHEGAALSRYGLAGPDGRDFVSDVAEFLTVENGLITSLTICFDTAPYPR